MLLVECIVGSFLAIIAIISIVLAIGICDSLIHNYWEEISDENWKARNLVLVIPLVAYALSGLALLVIALFQGTLTTIAVIGFLGFGFLLEAILIVILYIAAGHDIFDFREDIIEDMNRRLGPYRYWYCSMIALLLSSVGIGMILYSLIRIS